MNDNRGRGKSIVGNGSDIPTIIDPAYIALLSGS